MSTHLTHVWFCTADQQQPVHAALMHLTIVLQIVRTLAKGVMLAWYAHDSVLHWRSRRHLLGLCMAAVACAWFGREPFVTATAVFQALLYALRRLCEVGGKKKDQ